MQRVEFVQSLVTSGALLLLPPAASPSPQSAPPKQKQAGKACDVSDVLPYDRPLQIHMPVLDGPDFDLMKLRGYVVWMNIFATWCGPCNQEQPFVVQMAKEYYDQGLRVIGIDCKESDDTVRAYRKKYGIDYPIAMDRNGGFTGNIENGDIDRPDVFPAHIFINVDGYLGCYRKGEMGESAMVSIVNQLVAAVKPAPTPTASPMIRADDAARLRPG